MNMPRSTKPFCRDLLTKSQGTEISEMRYIFLSLSLSHFFFYLKISWPLACSYFWRVFWLNIVKNEVYLWYEYYSNLFDGMRREVKFSNTIIEILWKSRKNEIRKRKKEIWTVARVMLQPHTILPYFLQTADIINFLLIFIKTHQ